MKFPSIRCYGCGKVVECQKYNPAYAEYSVNLCSSCATRMMIEKAFLFDLYLFEKDLG